MSLDLAISWDNFSNVLLYISQRKHESGQHPNKELPQCSENFVEMISC